MREIGHGQRSTLPYESSEHVHVSAEMIHVVHDVLQLNRELVSKGR